MKPHLRHLPGVLSLFLLLVLPWNSLCRGQVLPPGDDEPVLRLEPGGPISPVTALAFGKDGQTLYEAGWDKVARVWRWEEAAGRLELDGPSTYRLPIGPGLGGAINALAISPDGDYLALAGNGIVRLGAGFRQNGLMVPVEAVSDDLRLDQGLIYVFSTRNPNQGPRILRGHLGPILALAFAPNQPGKPPLLAATARERGKIGSVRLWNVAEGSYLGGLWDLPDPQFRPGLALSHTGEAPNQVRVAIAWGDGKLRLWDADRAQGRLQTVDDGLFNNALVPFGEPGQYLSAAFDQQQGYGRLQAWQTSAGQPPRPLPDRQIAFRPEPGESVGYIPWALTLASSQAGGPTDLAAVVLVRVPGRGAEAAVENRYELRLIDIRPDHFGTERARVPLWTEGEQRIQPTLASAPGGLWLALAGDPRQAVSLYAIADLLNGRAEPLQQLQGAGETIRQAAFVRRGEDLGLRLNSKLGDPLQEPAADLDDLIFDFPNRQLTAEVENWRLDTPDLTGWNIRREPARLDNEGRAVPAAVLVRKGDGPEVRMQLPSKREVTAFALLPPRPPIQKPVVAVAWQELGEPGLSLHDGSNGEPLRRLTAHSNRIQSLAFSRDGRLLASAAEDRTVCVWSLTDLDDPLGKRKRLEGAYLLEEDSRIVVHLDPEQPARGPNALQEGDILEALIEDSGEVRPLPGYEDFAEAISEKPLGEAIQVRVLGEAGAPRDLLVNLVRGVDERKPLFSLFLTRGETPEDWRWIAWNPLGPYDASGREIEPLLGWHFNTGKADAPATFAKADQYRQFLREGLLGELIERGELPPPVAVRPIKRPEMTLALDPVGSVEDSGQIVLRQSPERLDLLVLDRRFPVDQVESVRWQIGDAPAQDLELTGDRRWSADLAGREWPKGVLEVRVRVCTKEATPQEFVEARTLRVQPPPPQVDGPSSPRPILVGEPRFAYKAEVRPAGGPATVKLIHRLGETTIAEETLNVEAGEPLSIEHPVDLEPGLNTIELIAANVDSLPGFEALETVRLAPLQVHFHKAPAPPPSISLESVVPLQGTEAGTPIPVNGGSIVLSSGRIRISGTIEAEEPLVQAVWVDPAGATRPVDGFEPDREKVFVFQEEIDLEPGPRTFRLRALAGAGDGEAAEALLTVDYQPKVPAVADLELLPGDPVIYPDPEGSTPELQLSARLVEPIDRQDFEAVILLNGEELAEAVEIDLEAGTIAAQISPQPGENRVQVRLSNNWNSQYMTEPVLTTYRRPPRIVEFDRPEVGDEPLVEISARLQSPSDRPPTRGEIQVLSNEGGTLRTVDLGAEAFQVEEEGGDTWTLKGRDVPLESGENTLRLLAWNADGPTLEAGHLKGVNYKARPPKKPTAEFLSPDRDTTISKAEAKVTIRVVSESPLRTVELLRLESETSREVLHKVEVESIQPDARGRFEYRQEIPIALNVRENPLRLLARNAGGEAIDSLVLSYVPSPPKVVIEAVEPKVRGGRILTPNPDERGQPIFEEATDGQLWLRGRVTWNDEAARNLYSASLVEVRVNGLRHTYADLTPIDNSPLEMEFRASLLLRQDENEVEVRLPGVPLRSSDRTNLKLSCFAPQTRQRLHLLIIGVGNPDEAGLRRQALNALNGEFREGSEEIFTAPAFYEGRIYGPVCDDVQLTRVFGQLERIRRAIDPLLGSPDAPQEVIVIYYEGKAQVEEDQTLLRLRRGEGTRARDAISLDDLASFFTTTRGVQLFVLDVERPDTETDRPLTHVIQKAEDEPEPHVRHVGLLSYTWWSASANEEHQTMRPEARLIASLEEAIEQAVTLSEVESGIERDHAELANRALPVTYDHSLPRALFDLPVGARYRE